MRTAFITACLVAGMVLPIGRVAIGSPVTGPTSRGTPIADWVSELASPLDRTHPDFFVGFDADGTKLLIGEMLAVGDGRQARRDSAPSVDIVPDPERDLVVTIDAAGLIHPAVYQVKQGEPRSASPVGSSSLRTETRPGHRPPWITVRVDPGAFIFDLDADGTIDRLTFAALVPRVVSHLAASGVSDVNPKTFFRVSLGGSALESLLGGSVGQARLAAWALPASPTWKLAGRERGEPDGDAEYPSLLRSSGLGIPVHRSYPDLGCCDASTTDSSSPGW